MQWNNLNNLGTMKENFLYSYIIYMDEEEERRFIMSNKMVSLTRLRNPIQMFREYKQPVKLNDMTKYKLSNEHFTQYKKENKKNIK